MSTWQGTQQPTSDPQFTTVASPGAGDAATTSGDSGTTDPWIAAFFDNGQTSTTGSTANASEATEQQSANDDDAATETAEGDTSLPAPTVSGGFTTTTTANGDATTTTYTLTSSISLESGSMAGGDANDNSRWDIPTDWIATASTIPEESDASESGDSENGDGDATVTSDDETDAAPTDESGVRFKANSTITVSVTTGPFTAPDGSTGTTTSITFGATGSVVIMVSGSWSTGDEGNTGTVLTAEDIASMGPSAVIEMPPSAAESSMTRAPRELILGGNGTSVTASGESFWYAYATIGFSVTISNTTMDNGAAGGGPSAPSASLNLSLGSGSFSTDQSDIAVQESSESGSGSNAKSVHVKEKNVSGSATSFALNLGGEGDAGTSTVSAAPAFTSVAGAADPADSSSGTTEEVDGPLSFSSSSFNSHQKTTFYGTQSSQQSASSLSSSSTNADIEDSSSGSTSLSFSISGFEYETTSGSKSEFSYLSESQSSSDSPVGSDGRPSTHSEAASSHVIETLDESDRTFGFGFGSDGLNVTNKYSSNETVSDVLKSESTSGSWRLVYPTITSSLAMMTNPQSTAPSWVAGPELEMTSGHNIQFNYGGNREDGFEGSYSETTGFSQEFLNQEGTVYRYEYTLTVQETFPNTNDGNGTVGDYSGVDAWGGGDESSDDNVSNSTADFGAGGAPQPGNRRVPDGGTVITQPNGAQYVYDADGNLYGVIGVNGNVYWPLNWPKPTEDPGNWAADPPLVKPPWMDWNAVDQNGNRSPRIHDDNFPNHVPKDWSGEKIQRLIDEVETSIENRNTNLDPTTESPEAHRRHQWRIEREEQWLEKLQRALKSVAGPAAATGATIGTGYSIYKALEGAGMFLDRATGVLFFMVSPPGMWDNHGGLGQGPG